MTALVDRSAPGVRVTVLPDERAREGVPVDLAGRILGFSYEDSERRADKAVLQLRNDDLALFARDELMGGQVLEVAWGYPGHLSTPRRVVVRSIKGFETLSIEARALSTLMDRRARTRSWRGMTRSEIAGAIAQEYGFDDFDIDDLDQSMDVIAQVGETDARFLRRLAAREDFEMYVDERGFHFHARRQDAAPTHVLTWYADPGRGDVLSVNVESDLVRRVGRVTVRGRDPITRTTIEEAATNETTERATLAEVATVIDPETGALRDASTSRETPRTDRRNATESVRTTSAPTPARARREAQARFRRAERAAVELSLKVVGDPTLRAGTVIEVRGISERLSGLYYLTTVKHTVDASGYVCELKASRDGLGRSGGTSRAERQAPGTAPNEPELGGERNRSQARENDGEPEVVDRIDGETGRTVREYRRAGQPLGAGDPEARR